MLGNLDIAERRLPQDGQFTIELANAAGLVSDRDASLHTVVRKIVLRLLHQVSAGFEPKGLV